jgi:hypothetical protein
MRLPVYTWLHGYDRRRDPACRERALLRQRRRVRESILGKAADPDVRAIVLDAENDPLD